MTFGQRLRELRKAKGMTQREWERKDSGILRKLGVTSRTGAAAIAVRRHLVA